MKGDKADVGGQKRGLEIGGWRRTFMGRYPWALGQSGSATLKWASAPRVGKWASGVEPDPWTGRTGALGSAFHMLQWILGHGQGHMRQLTPCDLQPEYATDCTLQGYYYGTRTWQRNCSDPESIARRKFQDECPTRQDKASVRPWSWILLAQMHRCTDALQGPVSRSPRRKLVGM